MRFIILFTLAVSAIALETWKVVDVDRIVDISSQIVKITTTQKIENVGGAGSSFDFAITSEEAKQLAHISAKLSTEKSGKLVVAKSKELKPGFEIFTITLPTSVKKSEQATVVVSVKLTGSLTPLPAKIAQDENQYVVYSGSAYFPTPYQVLTQKTTVKTTQGGKLLSATTVAPSKSETEKVVYGPYSNINAFTTSPISIHYENNSPFVVAAFVERVIEVSHWGNIAVEEYIELVHKGAELKGTFSRLDFQMDRRGRRQPAFLQFTTSLPATARDIYYRDEIGNISTSAVRVKANSVDLEIRPRFPLFGGWKTSYVIGYNLPSAEYLSSRGNQYQLRAKILDNIFENIVVERLVTKIILPEHIRNIKLNTPYTVERLPDTLKPTYLDISGRHVISVEKKNLVADHQKLLTITYEFDSTDMLREPLLATGFFFSVFLVFIIYARFDFSIASDPVKDTRDRIQSKLGKIGSAVEKKQGLYSQLFNAAAEFKQSREAGVLTEARQRFVSTRSDANERINKAVSTLQEESEESYQKAQELIKYDQNVVDNVEAFLKAVEKSTSKSAGQEEAQFKAKVDEARNKADLILASL